MMKVVITKQSKEDGGLGWWYDNRVGEVFDVYPDPKRESYYYTKTEHKGKTEELHIRKKDCIELDYGYVDEKTYDKVHMAYSLMKDLLIEMNGFGDLEGYDVSDIFQLIGELEKDN
ncbi:hypothetical protein NSS71_08170 [Niallia sp. FSL W8-0951]|uniref:hypothetical protein n=1 Tax=Niallia sp. FSL W8-0951 TaxID=2954639 RepID=UPI0030F82F68